MHGLRRLTLMALAVLTGTGPLRAPAAVQPNVLYILIDDLGWKDLGATGSTFYETPNIDRLLSQGTRFSQFYTASGVCSPTRASLMTGKAPARLHITDWIGGDDSGALLPAEYERQLPLSEVTIGEAFAAAGYATGYIGKWHLGDDGYRPTDQGFAFTRMVNHAGQPASYFAPYHGAKPSPADVPDLEGSSAGDYLTDQLTDAAVRFLGAPRTQPFFLMVSQYAVHTPIQAPTDLTAKYNAKRTALPVSSDSAERAEGHGAMAKQRQDHATYAAMIENLDTNVGRMLHALDSLGLTGTTIVVFVSDNGGLSTLQGSARGAPTSNTPLRAGKGWLYEGGIRAPFGVRWPGVVPAGRVIDTPTISTDLYPTMLALAGLPSRPSQHLDGVSLSPLLLGTGPIAERSLYWHFPHYHGSGNTPSGAIRKGSLKAVEWFETGRVELFDLASDPGETTDLAKRRPAETASLQRELAAWRRAVGANMPRKRQK